MHSPIPPPLVLHQAGELGHSGLPGREVSEPLPHGSLPSTCPDY